jgi:hypothetical protein
MYTAVPPPPPPPDCNAAATVAAAAVSAMTPDRRSAFLTLTPDTEQQHLA